MDALKNMTFFWSRTENIYKNIEKFFVCFYCSSGCECLCLCKDPFLRLQNVQSCGSCAVWGLKCEVCTDHKCNIETWCRVDIRTLEHFTSCNKTLTRGPEPSELELIRPGVRRRISLGSSLVTLAHLHTLHIHHTGGQVSYFYTPAASAFKM